MGAEVVSCILKYRCNGSVSYIVRIGGAKSCARSSLRWRSFTCYVKMSWEGAVGGRSERVDEDLYDLSCRRSIVVCILPMVCFLEQVLSYSTKPFFAREL